ncbi:MAG: HTH domain-containing protein [archaeon]
MDPIKEAFDKIKQDITLLKNEILNLKIQINSTQTNPIYNQPQIHQQTNKQTYIQTTQTHNQPIQPLYIENNNSSIGNERVPTNTPTNTPTHQQTQNYSNLTIKSDFQQVNEILDSLDNIKKGIRLKFKQLTPQEMLIFSVLYTLEEQKTQNITYKTLADKTNLSESSIRDYINKLIIKGIPVEKTRQNNKIIILNIAQDLKNITNLTIIQDLRAL